MDSIESHEPLIAENFLAGGKRNVAEAARFQAIPDPHKQHAFADSEMSGPCVSTGERPLGAQGGL